MKYKGHTYKLIWHVIKGFIVLTMIVSTISLLCHAPRMMFLAVTGDICACSCWSTLHKVFSLFITSLWSCVKGKFPSKNGVLRCEVHKYTFRILMSLHLATYCSSDFFFFYTSWHPRKAILICSPDKGIHTFRWVAFLGKARNALL